MDENMQKRYWICFFILIVNTQNENAIGQETQGPYTVHINSIKKCMASNWLNVSDITLKIVDSKLAKIAADYAFYATMKIDSAIIEIFKINKRNKILPFWKYNIKHPCQHFISAPFLKFMIQNNNCELNKGNFSTEVEIGSVMKKMFGPSMLYTRLLGKTTFKSQKGVIFCVRTDIQVVPLEI